MLVKQTLEFLKYVRAYMNSRQDRKTDELSSCMGMMEEDNDVLRSKRMVISVERARRLDSSL